MRWKMHKLGFLNFWLYDREEFLLDDGHLLLRGDNASGKSITTQSFIPFILDGDRRPERLDPFGSRDRKMEFYLLGDGEKEDATGYLYLEFRKPDVEEYRTIGVGMRAQRDRGITRFWGFCLCDGRRIGPGGLSLCENRGNSLMPLSWRQLRDRLSGSCWADSPGEYKELVNREIFGFSDIREYDQLIQLLIKVRAPKLSKDMRPGEVKTILRDALQVLTDADLDAMKSVMERMDQMEDTLQDYQAAMEDVKSIRREYTRYNRYMLGTKGKAYLEALGESRKREKNLADCQREREAVREALEQRTGEQEEARRQLDQASARRAEMGEDSLTKKHAALEEHLGRAAAYQNRIDALRKELSGLDAQIAEQEALCQTRKRQTEEAVGKLHGAVRELEAVNKLLLLGEEHRQYVRALEQEESRETEAGETEKSAQAEREQAASALAQRRKRIREVLKTFQELDGARSVCAHARSLLEEAERVYRDRQETLRDAREQEHQEHSRLTETLARWRQENRQLLFPTETWQSLRAALEAYQGPADWGPIQKLVYDCFRAHDDELQWKRQDAETGLRRVEEDLREKKRELNQVLDQPDPVPPRREAVRSARTQLTMEGIPFAAFYEIIDFAPDLPQGERDLLEAQLLDAGLLDALLVPEDQASALGDFLAEYPDCFLLPGPAAEQPVTGLTAAEGPFRGLAEEALRSISGSDLEAETALLPDGRFRNGILRGHSHAEDEARYVGPETRRSYRERLLSQLRASVEELSVRVQEGRDRLNDLDAARDILRRERDRLPTADDWNQAIDMAREAEKDCRRAEAEADGAREKERKAQLALSALEQELRQRSTGLPYGQRQEDWEEAQDAAEEYQTAMTGADAGLRTLFSAKAVETASFHTLESFQQQRESNARSLADNLRDRDREQVQADTLREELNRPENRERERRLLELNRSIKEWREKLDAAVQACSRLEERQSNLAESTAQAAAQLEQARRRERLCGAYFTEDLDLGLSQLRREDGLDLCAKRAVEELSASDQNRTGEDMGDALRRNFLAHNNSLLKYQADNSLIFDPPEDGSLSRQRLCVTLRMEGKTLSLYEFAEALQGKIDEVSQVWSKQDRKTFENILMDTVSKKLRARIAASRDWVQRMTKRMESLRTSMDLTFSLEWKERPAESEDELGTAELVKLLSRDANLLTTEDSDRLTGHFLSQIKRLREEAIAREEVPNYTALIHEALDYRNWYQFHIFYRRGGEQRKELTDRVFNRFSGGEKAMSTYIPLFASVSAHYQKAREDAPLLLALDEAFAGVDEKNIAAMFDLLHTLDFDYIINSQVLWGCYACVENLDIAELRRPGNAAVVTIMRCHWNGRRRETEEEL